MFLFLSNLITKLSDALLIKCFLFKMNFSHCGGFLTDFIATILVIISAKSDCWYSYRGNLPIYGNILVRANLWGQCVELLDDKVGATSVVVGETIPSGRDQHMCEYFNVFDIPRKFRRFFLVVSTHLGWGGGVYTQYVFFCSVNFCR